MGQARCRKPSVTVDEAQLDKAGILVRSDPEGLDEVDSFDAVALNPALGKADEQIDLSDVTKEFFLEGPGKIGIALGRRGDDVLALGGERLEHVDPDRANHCGAAQNDEDIAAESAQHGGSRNSDRILYRLSPARAPAGFSRAAGLAWPVVFIAAGQRMNSTTF